MQNNKRRSARIPIKLDVELFHPELGSIFIVTKDISDTGIFLRLPAEQQPEVGTTVQVKLKNNFDDGGEPPTLDMLVARQCPQGVGLDFIL